MYTKNLLAYNYNANKSKKIRVKFDLVKVLVLFLLVIVTFAGLVRLYESLTNTNNNSLIVADFKTDINMLSETANVLETQRASSGISELSKFGSDGKMVHANEITPELSKALLTIADVNNDGKLDDSEISALGIMKLKPEVFQNGLKTLQFKLRSSDHNLKKFIIITEGKYAGTVLYNGNQKYVDDENKRYFGLELAS